ncbi:RNA polymerase subunit sigma-70 [Viridibacillus arvi]|uniref:RNA polymerase subunit sigma-70 n=1 Tax=Viridibacillus arvi TaxID=263475 RepID=UPI003D05F524
MKWAHDLLIEYSKGKKELQRMKVQLKKDDREVEKQINSMIDSMTFAINWMETGRDPDSHRGIDKKSIYHKQFFESIDVIPDITDQLYDIDSKQLYMTSEEKSILADIFTSWSLKERHCYIEHVVNNKSLQTIANDLNIGKSTVQKYIERAKNKVNNKVL